MKKIFLVGVGALMLSFNAAAQMDTLAEKYDSLYKVPVDCGDMSEEQCLRREIKALESLNKMCNEGGSGANPDHLDYDHCELIFQTTRVKKRYLERLTNQQ
ncbi:MAG: hypothetical protein GJ680_18365 [Alteromonadaceae bacterium]|nr:hypothetical protein [Alteromonadaceae bacterium]